MRKAALQKIRQSCTLGAILMIGFCCKNCHSSKRGCSIEFLRKTGKRSTAFPNSCRFYSNYELHFHCSPFFATEPGDQKETICPAFAHIRKTYPRDDITPAAPGDSDKSGQATQTHRLLRRGIPSRNTDGAKGLGHPHRWRLLFRPVHLRSGKRAIELASMI